jgi:hypothetical protein
LTLADHKFCFSKLKKGMRKLGKKEEAETDPS